MAQEDINRGSYAGDDQGEDLYTAFGKCISNFNELYTGIGATAIKAAYESNSNTEAFTTAEKNKLGTIEDSADVTDKTNVLSALDAVILDTDIGTTVMAVTDAILFKDATDNSLKYREMGSVPFPGDSLTSANAGGAGEVPMSDGSGGVDWADISTTYATLSALSANGGAALIGLLDSGDNYTGNNLESVLLEIATAINANASAISSVGNHQAGEYTASGTLVYPSWVPQTIQYDAEGRVIQWRTTDTYNSVIWSLLVNGFDHHGNASSLIADDAGLGHTWRKEFTYNYDGVLIAEGDWVAL